MSKNTDNGTKRNANPGDAARSGIARYPIRLQMHAGEQPYILSIAYESAAPPASEHFETKAVSAEVRLRDVEDPGCSSAEPCSESDSCYANISPPRNPYGMYVVSLDLIASPAAPFSSDCGAHCDAKCGRESDSDADIRNIPAEVGRDHASAEDRHAFDPGQRNALTDEVYRQILSYFGQTESVPAVCRTEFDFPFLLRGTPFQIQVWKALCQIPYGETRSYKDIAEALGRPRAYRAVGGANNKNPISLAVPCHRVIGADGSLVGYGLGVGLKEFLLSWERRKELAHRKKLECGKGVNEGERGKAGEQGNAVGRGKEAKGSSTLSFRRIRQSDFKTTQWSGGTTTELFIEPPGADFKERSFLYRISSATFTDTESDFSDFTGYQRFILPLAGGLRLCQARPDFEGGSPASDPLADRGKRILPAPASAEACAENTAEPESGAATWKCADLAPYEVYEFSGAAKIHAYNTPDCVDFNLIVREEMEAAVEVLNPDRSREAVITLRGGAVYLYSLSDFSLVELLSGKSLIEEPFSEELCTRCSPADRVEAPGAAPLRRSVFDREGEVAFSASGGGCEGKDVSGTSESCRAGELIEIRGACCRIRIRTKTPGIPVIACYVFGEQ